MTVAPARRLGYFSAYGGWRALLKSKFFWGAGVLTLLAFPMWQAPGWWSTVLGVCPDLLGFALAAFALTMGIGSERFRRRLGGSIDGSPSPFMRVAGTFTYFIIVQCLALGYAILAQTYFIQVPAWLLEVAPWAESLPDYREVGWFFGIWLFVYAMLLTVAAGKAMFVFARWFDEYGVEKEEPKNECNCRCPCSQGSKNESAETTDLPPPLTNPSMNDTGNGVSFWIKWRSWL